MAEIEEKFVVKTDIQRVWNFLLDVNRLVGFVPGCKKIEAVDDKNFDVEMEVKIGPISTHPKLRITITDMEPPLRLESIGRGVDQEKASNFSLKNSLALRKISEEETEVAYKTDVTITGTLGKFGWGIMKSKAQKMAQEFAAGVKRQLEGD